MIQTKHDWTLFTRSYFVLFLAVFGFFMNLGILIPVTPLYAHELGATEALIGLITGAFAAAAVVTRIAIGPYVNRQPRLLLVLGSTIFFLAPILYMLSSSPWELFVARLVHGTGIAVFTLSVMTLIANMTPQTRQGEAMGVYGLFVASAHAGGPFLGGFLEDMFGFTGTFMAASGFALLSGLLGALVKDVQVVQTHSTSAHKGYQEVLRDRNVQLATFGIFVLTITYGVLMAYGPLYIQELGMSSSYVGLFFTVVFLGTMIGRPTMGKLSDTKGRTPVIMFAMCLTVFSMYALSKLITAATLGFMALTYGLGFGAANAAQTALTIDTVAPQHRSSALAIYTACFDIGISAGSIGIGFIAEAATIGYSLLFQIAAGILLLGLGIVSYFSLQQNR